MEPGSCLNCGTPLQGPHCHACGQPVKGLVRPLGSIVHDFLDTVFEYDSRIWRTLLPLYALPGRITRDYLAGKRMRFVLPFRLFFVLTVLAFLMLQWTLTATAPFSAPGGAMGELAPATTQRELQAERERLERAEAAREQGRPVPPEPAGSRLDLGHAELWDRHNNPVTIDWLPRGANDRINSWIERGMRNIERVDEDPQRLIQRFLGLLPAVLFVLVPIFALLLKLFYVFSGRLYMEHLVVALHSHSFLALALLVMLALQGLLSLATPGGVAHGAASTLTWLAQLWVPVYLIVMQRRIYAESWSRTCTKFALIGITYAIILALATAVAVLISLVTA